MTLLFSSLQHCHNNNVFMITSIKHMQLSIHFLISLNKSLLFLHKNLRQKQRGKDEKRRKEREKID